MSDDYMRRLGLVELPGTESQGYDGQEDVAPVPSKKATQRKQNKNVVNDEDTKKGGKRGRPRVDPSDESAIERRRTQIRLAQRAYRERKETTISELEKRVSQLQSTIADMSQIYSEFNNKALAAGLAQWSPALLQELTMTTQRFTELSSAANFELDAEEDSPRRKKPRHKPSMSEDAATTTHLRSGNEQGQSPSTDSSNNQPDPSEMLGYQIYDSTPERDIDAGMQPMQQAPWPNEGMQLQQYHAHMPNAPAFTERWKEWVDKPMKPIYTYNFQEISFWRRLIRYSYEQAYHLLTNPTSPPEKIERILRYSLCLGDKKRIAEAIKKRLMKSADEPLEVWGVPVLHIGGAGLHYPREGVDDTNTPVQERDRNFGPYPWRPGVRDVPVEDFPFALEKFANVEGVWFDAYDVEQYLKEKGIFLDGTSPIAIVEVDDTASLSEIPFGSPQSSSTDSFSLPQSPVTRNDLTVGFTGVSNVDEMFTDFDIQDSALSSNFSLDFSSAIAPSLAKGTLAPQPVAALMQTSELPTPAIIPSKKRVVIDVDRLLEELNRGSVCLGRAPGFKQENVDAAVQTVLKEAW